MPQERNALFVRLTADQAARLDRAASALPAHKKDLIGGLVERYVDPSTPEGLEALRTLTSERKVVIELPKSGPVVGHADFRPAEVLDAEGAADLLDVAQEEIVALAERGELPGRKIGAAWRFSRVALLTWLDSTSGSA
jgi:excisionase family DNA binding protein